MQGQFRGDFTRDPFKHFKHFSRVLIQQGRVHLDADWNEQAAILLHFMRSLAADFSILPGHYYLDGILCELEATPVSIIEVADPSGSEAIVTLDRPMADGI